MGFELRLLRDGITRWKTRDCGSEGLPVSPLGRAAALGFDAVTVAGPRGAVAGDGGSKAVAGLKAKSVAGPDAVGGRAAASGGDEAVSGGEGDEAVLAGGGCELLLLRGVGSLLLLSDGRSDGTGPSELTAGNDGNHS